MISKTIPISTRITKSCRMNKSILFQFEEKSVETETIKWSEFSKEAKAAVNQTLGSEEKNKPKRGGLQQLQFKNQGKLTIWARSLQIRKNIIEFILSISHTKKN